MPSSSRAAKDRRSAREDDMLTIDKAVGVEREKDRACAIRRNAEVVGPANHVSCSVDAAANSMI